MYFRKIRTFFKKFIRKNEKKMSQLISERKKDYNIKNRYKKQFRDFLIGVFCDPFKIFKSRQGNSILSLWDVGGMIISIVAIVTLICSLYWVGGLFLKLLAEDGYLMLKYPINNHSFLRIVVNFTKEIKNLANGGDVLGGFVTIWIGILIYMADSKGKEKSFKSKVLFDNTSIWALSVSTIFLFISQNWGSIVGINTDYGYLPISILGLGYVYVTGIIIKISTYSGALDKGIMKYLNEEIKKDVEEGINNIIGQEIFAKKIDEDSKLSYNPFWDRKNGTVVLSDKSGVVTDMFFGSTPISANSSNKDEAYIYLRAKFGDRIGKGSVLGVIDKVIGEDKIPDIVEEIRHMYKIDADKDTGSELEERVEILLNEISTSISNKDPLELRRSLKLFRNITENTMDIFQEMNIKIKCFELSKVSRDFFGNGIEIFNLIRETAWEIYRLAPKNLDNSRADLEFREVLSFIESMIYTSLNKDDRPFFVIFSEFIPVLISDGIITGVNGNAEGEGMRLSNFFQYHLFPHLKTIKEEDSCLDLARYTLLIARNIIVKFLNSENSESCLEMVDILYEFDQYGSDASEEYTKIFSQERSKMLFGLGAYLAKKLGTRTDAEDKLTIEHQLLIKILRLICRNFTEWTKIYASSSQRDDEDLWSCRFLDRIPSDGRLYPVDGSGPGRLYIIGALSLNDVEYSPSEDVPDLFYHRDFRDLISSTKMLGIDISEEKRINLTKQFRELTLRVRKQRLNNRRMQNLSEKVVNGFKRNIQDNFRKVLISTSQIVGSVKKEHIHSDITYGTGGQIIEKDCFLEDGGISIDGLGKNIGRQGGLELQQLVLSSIFQNCQPILGVNRVSLLEKIDELLRGMTDPIIILTGRYNYGLRESITTRSLVGKPELGISGFYIRNHSIPVFDPYYGYTGDTILVVDRAKLNSLKISPTSEAGDPGDPGKIDYLDIPLTDLNSDQDLLNKFLSDPPPWIAEKLKEYEDSLEEYLRDSVYFRVSYKYEFLPQHNCGFSITVVSKDEEDV